MGIPQRQQPTSLAPWVCGATILLTIRWVCVLFGGWSV